VTTSSGSAFAATGGGSTINVTTGSTPNTLTSTTGTALNVTNTTIGASGMTFLSISSNGAPNGINMLNTGAGPFTVTGNGSTCTLATQTCDGGSIQSSTGQGILLNKVGAVSLTRMKIQNSGTLSVGTPPIGPVGGENVCNGACINGFSMDNSIITDSAGAASDNGLVLTNVIGAVSITNSAISNIPHNGVDVDNFNFNMASFTFTGNTVQCQAGQPCQPSGSLGNDGVLVSIRGTSILNFANVQGSTFTGMRATGIQVVAGDSARIGSAASGQITAPVASNSVTVQNNTFTGNNVGVDISQSQVANLAFQILNNSVVARTGATTNAESSQAINTFSAAGADTGPASHFHVGIIQGNTIGTPGVIDSGSGFGNGIRAVVQGQNTQGVVTIDGNQIREVSNAGNGIISIFGQNGAAATGTGTARFKVTNNTITRPSGTNLNLGCGGPCDDDGIFILADEGFPVCASIATNNIFDVTTEPGGAFDVYLATRTGPPAGAHITIQTGVNGGNSAAALAFINGNNTLNGANKSFDEAGNMTTTASCGNFP